MPPRIPAAPCLRAPKAPLSFQLTLPIRSFSASAIANKNQRSRDPYVAAQKARKKAANLSRRADLEAARVASLGDPVRGTTTRFVESFANASPVTWTKGTFWKPKESQHLNYAFDPQIVHAQLNQSKKIAVPLDEVKAASKLNKAGFSSTTSNRNPWAQEDTPEPSKEELEAQREKDHERATEAIKRITALENSSSKDRMRVNIARCVSTFGRHKTDTVLPPRAPSLRITKDGKKITESHDVRPATNESAAAKRVGPDTGSSEVQIAILTAKIKTVADFLQSRGKGDKHNKRNLRLLVHRRQKLLQYLRRKERGGPRWQHCIETLGLTEGTWKGEISL